MKMQLPIFETQNFYIQAARRPFVDRAEGGHLYLFPKISVRDRTQLAPHLAIEYTKLSMVIGEALVSAMARRGVDIGIVNYQDMGTGASLSPKVLAFICKSMVVQRLQSFRNMAMPYNFRIAKLDFMTTSSH